jgi:hypothetical protein
MNDEEFFTEELNCDDQLNDLTIDYDDYPEFDSLEYTTDW